MRIKAILLVPVTVAAVFSSPATAQESPSQAPRCGGISVPSDSDNGTVDVTTVAGAPARLGYSTPAATSTVTVTRTSPDPVAVVRKQAAEGGRVEFVFQTNVNTVLESRTSDDASDCPALVRRISVAPRVTLAARRNTVRDYTFSGQVFPARGQTVTLYRVPANSNEQIITARSTVQPDGNYTINRRFTGSGDFVMYTVAGPVPSNSRGFSRGRPTVIH